VTKALMAVTSMTGKAAWNKSSLLLNNILQNTQTLQLFTMNIKQKVFTKVIKNVKLEDLGRETYWSLKEVGSTSAKLRLQCFD
jgi:hypothetical protein